MTKTWFVSFQGTVDIDTTSTEIPYKQIYDAVRDNKLSTMRIVSADPINEHIVDDD